MRVDTKRAERREFYMWALHALVFFVLVLLILRLNNYYSTSIVVKENREKNFKSFHSILKNDEKQKNILKYFISI